MDEFFLPFFPSATLTFSRFENSRKAFLRFFLSFSLIKMISLVDNWILFSFLSFSMFGIFFLKNFTLHI